MCVATANVRRIGLAFFAAALAFLASSSSCSSLAFLPASDSFTTRLGLPLVVGSCADIGSGDDGTDGGGREEEGGFTTEGGGRVGGGEEEGDLSASMAISSWSRESAGGLLRGLAGDGTLDGAPGGGSGHGSRGLGVRS